MIALKERLSIAEGSKIEALRRRYRRCLLAVGKSPDYHIDELSLTWLLALRPSKERDFLVKMRKFYASLDFINRIILVREVLEGGRHYPFWHYGIEFVDGGFLVHKRNLVRNLSRQFP